MSGDTPVAMVRWGTTGRQHSSRHLGASRTWRAPAVRGAFVTVIGDVVKLREKLNWFERRPFRRRIVVTRTREQATNSPAGCRVGADVLESRHQDFPGDLRI